MNPVEAEQAFFDHFNARPDLLARAPGRVNIIGEHTDYNHGFVLPMAIERYTCILARKRSDLVLNAYAANPDRAAEADLANRQRNADEPWLDYVVGVADELVKLDLPISGADCLIFGDVPVGCGLSSSASLEMAALAMFEALGEFEMDGPDAARLGQRVENVFLGLQTGIMDQFISRIGRWGHALFLDCRTFDYEQIAVAFDSAKFVIANTGVARGLTSSKYNERVEECRRAVAAVGAPQATHLRDLDLAALESARGRMPDPVYRRARHVITENRRTIEACKAMRAGDAQRLGQLMNESDASLREDYEVTCRELDAMTAIARELAGCHGARMTGAGFGGCTINLVDGDHAETFGRDLTARYTRRTGLPGEIIISGPAQGAGVERW